MGFLSVFNLGGLMIWVPGLLFFALVMYTLYVKKAGRATPALYQGCVVLLIIGLIVAFMVPRAGISRTLAFANNYAINYEGYDGPEITSIADISYATMDAWRRTALPEDEQQGAQAAGGDIFAFDSDEGAAAEGEEAAEVATGAAGSGETIVYKPYRGFAWFVLMFFMIPGIIFLLQDVVFRSTSQQEMA